MIEITRHPAVTEIEKMLKKREEAARDDAKCLMILENPQKGALTFCPINHSETIKKFSETLNGEFNRFAMWNLEH